MYVCRCRPFETLRQWRPARVSLPSCTRVRTATSAFIYFIFFLIEETFLLTFSTERSSFFVFFGIMLNILSIVYLCCFFLFYSFFSSCESMVKLRDSMNVHLIEEKEDEDEHKSYKKRRKMQSTRKRRGEEEEEVSLSFSRFLFLLSEKENLIIALSTIRSRSTWLEQEEWWLTEYDHSNNNDEHR